MTGAPAAAAGGSGWGWGWEELPGALWERVAERAGARGACALAGVCRATRRAVEWGGDRCAGGVWLQLLRQDFGSAAAHGPGVRLWGPKRAYAQLHGRGPGAWEGAITEAVLRPELDSAHPPAMAVASNSRVLGVATGAGYIKVFDRNSREVDGEPLLWRPYEPMSSRAAHWPAMVHHLELSEDRMFSCGGDRTSAVFSLETGLQVHRHTAGDERVVNRFACNPDRSHLLVDCAEDGSANLLDIAGTDWRLLQNHRLEGYASPVYCVRWLSPDTFLAGSFDSCVRLWDARTGRPAQGLNFQCHYASAAVLSLASNDRLVFTGHADSAIRVWDRRKGGGKDGKDAAGGALLGTLRGHVRWVEDLALGPKVLASTSGDCTVRLWDLRDLKLVHTWRQHPSLVWGACFHGSESLVSCSLDGTVCSHNLDACTSSESIAPARKWPRLPPMKYAVSSGEAHRTMALESFTSWRPQAGLSEGA